MIIDTATLACCLGHTRSVQGGWIASCPVPGHGRGRGDRNPSLSIKNSDGRTLVYCHAGCSQDDVIQALLDCGIWPSPKNHQSLPTRSSVEPNFRSKSNNTEAALKLWRQGHDVRGTVVERYLAERGITGPIPSTIRYLPDQKHDDGNFYPVMISAIATYPDIKVCGIQRTYLSHSGDSKALVTPNKKMLGPVKCGAVRLGPAAKSLAVAEGIETALSVQQATGLSVWAALSTGGLKHLILPEPSIVETVIICADNDEAGNAAALVAAEKWTNEGYAVKIASPPSGQDFNDILTSESLNSKGDR